MTRVALLQMTAGIDPAQNARSIAEAAAKAARGGAAMLFTPEMSGLLDRDRARAAAHVVDEDANPVRTLRMRYDAWGNVLADTAPQGLAPSGQLPTGRKPGLKR